MLSLFSASSVVLLALYLVCGGGAPFVPIFESSERRMPVVFLLAMFSVIDVDESWPSAWCVLSVTLHCVVS
jgi:hypothetical protein